MCAIREPVARTSVLEVRGVGAFELRTLESWSALVSPGYARKHFSMGGGGLGDAVLR